jgi:hypothetical protein
MILKISSVTEHYLDAAFLLDSELQFLYIFLFKLSFCYL